MERECCEKECCNVKATETETGLRIEIKGDNVKEQVASVIKNCCEKTCCH